MGENEPTIEVYSSNAAEEEWGQTKLDTVDVERLTRRYEKESPRQSYNNKKGKYDKTKRKIETNTVKPSASQFTGNLQINDNLLLNYDSFPTTVSVIS